jgi:hypothetical protein
VNLTPLSPVVVFGSGKGNRQTAPARNTQESRLFFLIEALCSEMGAAFEALGRPLPPWRCLDPVVARWQPRRFVDVPVGDPLEGAARGRASLAGGDAGVSALAEALAAHGIC